MKYVQVGKGRLGGLIAQAVQSCGVFNKIQFAKINKHLGLCNEVDIPLKGSIERLVICIAPSASNQWQWSEILNGIEKQINDNHLMIQQLIFISSTRVYDGISSGVISASTKALGHSPAAINLIAAEQQLKKLACNVLILRCSGLYSEHHLHYEKYSKILFEFGSFDKNDKIRFAVSVEDIADKVVQLLVQKITLNLHRYYLLTDGYGYLNGEKLEINDSRVNSLKNRILKLSDCCF